MISLLKPSVVSDTGSAHKLFNGARLKLTGVSVVVVASIVFGFSYYIYKNITSDVVDIGSHVTAVGGDSVQQKFVEQTTTSVINSLVYADIGMLALAAILSFYFAGRTLRPIQKANAAQRAFATNASHELRTPLAILKSDTETLSRARQPSNDLVQEIVRSNLEEIERMEHIVENLLALARSEQTTLQPKEHIDIATTTKHIVKKLKPIAEKRGIRLSYKGVAPLPVRGGSDIDRAIMNVIQNSLNHTDGGGSITVIVKKNKQRACVTIADTGSGISEKDLPHVFERFYKGEGGRGSGLGLSIVKEIVERYGGTVSLLSTVRKGTTVSMNFPHLT